VSREEREGGEEIDFFRCGLLRVLRVLRATFLLTELTPTRKERWPSAKTFASLRLCAFVLSLAGLKSTASGALHVDFGATTKMATCPKPSLFPLSQFQHLFFYRF
jgi:hypothetical protein